MKYFEPNLIDNIQKLINEKDLLIISFENNEKILNLKNYKLLEKINFNRFNDKVPEYFYIYAPNKCDLN